MTDYTAHSNDERWPLTHAFVTAFEHATDLRVALVHAADEPLDPAEQAESLAAQLAMTTRKLAREAMAWTGAAGDADIAAAQYAFVALLDELLLFSEWPGAAVWEARPLEVRVFNTRDAGEKLPDAIEALLAQRDPSRRDLANVYLACLTLGFKGRLRGEAGALRHDQLRHSLFAFAMQRDAEPTHLAAPLERTAVAPRHPSVLTQMFPDLARFALVIGAGLCVLLGVSQVLWLVATAHARQSIAQYETVSLADARTTAPEGASGASGTVVPSSKVTGGGLTPFVRRAAQSRQNGETMPSGPSGPAAQTQNARGFRERTDAGDIVASDGVQR
jgi:type VI secretion system protein ImpK